MPALPVVTNGYLVSQLFDDVSGELHTMECTWCVIAGHAVAPNVAADVVAQDSYTAFKNVVPTRIQWSDTIVIPLDGTTATSRWTTTTAGSAGLYATGTALPNSCAQGVTWRTGERGRSKRGRSYIPGVNSGQVVNLETRPLTDVAKAALQTAATDFLSLMAAEVPTFALAVLSRKLGLATVVDDASANPGVVEQRRRYERVAHR